MIFSLLQSKKYLTMLEIEQSFGSNIRRCTAYRPILDAFKRFATDAPKRITITDIEDLTACTKNCGSCDKLYDNDVNDWCFLSAKYSEDKIIKINLKDDKT